MLQIWKAAVYEGIGSMMLVWLVGVTSLVFATGETVGTGLAIGILFALATALGMYVLGPLTGGHINPFITLAQMGAGSFPLVRGASYIVSQILGSMVGGAFVGAAMGSKLAHATGNGGCLMKPQENFGYGQAFALEFMAAFILLFLVHGTGIAKQQVSTFGKRFAPMLFGLSVGLLNFATSGFAITSGFIGSTGYPNVCFGLAAGIMQFDSSHWVFWIPGFVAVALWGLAERFLSPYEALEENYSGDGVGAYRTEEATRNEGKFGQA